MKKFILLSLLIFSINLQAQVARPPQFVMLAFDNCQENQSWDQVSQFLKEMNSVDTNRLKFTFFLSATGLITDENKAAYKNPGFLLNEGAATINNPEESAFPERAFKLARGKSFPDFGVANINFGGTAADVLKRIASINALHKSGNEIASHAVGHFNAARWTTEMWRHEFQQYNYIISHVAEINGFQGSQRDQAQLNLKPQDLTGFRAPYLEGGKILLGILKEFGFKYDASDTDQGWEPNTWPRKNIVAGQEASWNFGLGFIIPPGMTAKVPAMDYNFCYRQDQGCQESYPDSLKTAEQDGAVMLKAYTDYFLANYHGNRAPLHIGHHFQQYRGGIYNKALFQFAKKVCALPEVRCTTYQELTKFMDSLPAGTRNEYQRGNFPKL